MFLEIILIALTFLVLIIASYTDLKTTEVPDWLNFGFIGIAFLIRGLLSFQEGLNVLLSGFIGFAIFFIIACILYYTHQWGGGDSKLLIGLGAAIGVSYPFSQSSLQWLWFLLVLLFVGAGYGLIWMVAIAIKKRNLFLKRFHKMILDYRKMHYAAGGFSILILLAGSKITALLPLAILPVAVFYILLFVDSVEKSCFFKRVEPQELIEGDWLMEKITVGEKLIPKKTLLKQEIALLKEWKDKGKIGTVLIKEGIPFVPSFLLAYSILIIFGSEIGSFLGVFF